MTFRCALLLMLALALPAHSVELRDGDVVLYRHALAPGGGDPARFQLGDCSSQRNLSAEGREQARRMGQQLRQRLGALRVAAVWASPWCRTLETAQLAFADVPAQAQPAFGSFFQESQQRQASQLDAARALLAPWRGPGVLVVVTHQVNITGLSGVFPASGEGVVMRWTDSAGHVAGRLAAPAAP
ncbi:histidine phosphatase family protein [Roseateles asaccharophilus]|uniref:Broad specificity phosphatase PhoE n=1 Tax=Roseateles asaccharophilus TaxID=582607 RepID=A0ABU2A5D7_9BURK|nr:histidine phosphatase family protein [Roseateles asaccharophilus]MDR7331813.1 broad specificity phosphatase PhoE [Roseateles asaccharophilus]